MTEANFLKLYKAHIFHTHGTQSKAAEFWGVSSSFISLVISGVRRPSTQMLKDVGFTVKKESTNVYKKV